MSGLAQAGAFHAVRRRGHGTEFHQLREYRQGDSRRLVDWKATGRLRKPVVREYQEEQNQEIHFVLDSGYRMHASEGGVSHFDRALEIDPAYGDAYLGRGTAYFFLKDMKAACRDWNEARSFGNVQASRLIGLHCNGK